MTRKEQKERTKDLLLSVAYEQFSKNGIQETKTIDIAKAASVSHGTLFLHFPTRDDILLAAVTEFGMRIGKSFQQLKGGKIEQVLQAHLKILEEYEPFYTKLIIESALLPEAVRNHLILIQSGISHHLEMAIKEKLKLPISFILNTWIGLIHHYLMNGDLFAPEKSVLKVKGKELLNNFTKLLGESYA